MKSTVHDEKVVWTVHHFAAIRRAVLRVIDDGDQQNRGKLDKSWLLYEHLRYRTKGNTEIGITEEYANAQRLDFCSAVQSVITKEVTEA